MQIRVRIERLGHRGDGIAEGPAGPVYAAGMLPGEVVEGALRGDRLEEARILSPSAERRRPPCRHARRCGGCALQHAQDGFVAGWKRAVVEAALAAQGLGAEVREAVTSPPAARRRAVLAGRRGRAGAVVGFHLRGSEEILAVPGCLLLRPALMAVFPALEALVEAGATRKGVLSLAVTETLGGVDVVVAGGKPADAVLGPALAAIAETAGLARLVWGGEVVALRAAPAVAMGAARVILPPGGFLQATAEGEAALVGFVRTAVEGAGRVIDLFAGCGTFALPLAEHVAVHAVEGEAALVAALDAGARATPGLRPVTTELRDLFRRPLLADEFRAGAVVIDPPRAGAAAQVAEIARARVPVVAMVSCNPATFARDAAVLVGAGYSLGPVLVVDQFRWSTHVELAARLSLSHMPA